MKKCTKCGESKPEEDFPLKRGVRVTPCLVCKRVETRQHYQNNKQYYIDKARRRELEVVGQSRAAIAEYLSSHPCVDCGNTDIRVLEFDHVRGNKSFNVADAVKNKTSIARIMREVELCEVRCANCHRIATIERGGFHRSLGVQSASVA